MNNEIIKSRLKALRSVMRSAGVDAVIIPTGDPHLSEYSSEHFSARAFITGFTGSAGTAVVTGKEAGLWTDSRYYIQAEQQLRGTGIDLYRMQESGVPSITAFLLDRLSSGQTAAFDGSVVSCAQFDQWNKELSGAGIHIKDDADLAGSIWETRPELIFNPVFEYSEEYAGRSRSDKLKDVRAAMSDRNADCLIMSSLDDIAWLLNLRGSDVHCNPVFFSYLVLRHDSASLFACESSFTAAVLESLRGDGVEIFPYESVNDSVKDIPAGSAVWLPEKDSNSRLRACIPADAVMITEAGPVAMFKAVKNAAEQEHMKIAHIHDGAAVTKWIYWLKKNTGSEEITEISAAEKLHQLRAEQPGFMDDSFDPIVGYGAHAAIVHYSSTPETDVRLEPHGLVLADTGGQYIDGTTDITRTIALGPVTDEERSMFTAVLIGHIRLADAVFRRGCTGANLDILAHSALWSRGLDYGHGTGHGVGQFLNVHEGPVSIHWAANGHRPPAPPFEPGMIVSDEPGFYKEGCFGIRHEGLLLCRQSSENEYGSFLEFEEITLVPFDLDALDTEMMSETEKKWLNSYHRNVREAISPFLSDEENEWLTTATREI